MNIYQYYDQYGIIIFAFIAWDAYDEIRKGRKNWRTYSRLAIGIAGFVIDLMLVTQ